MDIPRDFAEAIEDLCRMNPERAEQVNKVARSPDLVDLWTWASRRIERHHERSGSLAGPVEGWKRRFAKDVFLALFAPQIAGGDTLAKRVYRRRNIATKARELARLLAHDPELLPGFRDHREAKRDAFDAYRSLRYVTGLAEDLEKLAAFADQTPIELHPFEPANPNAKWGHVNQKARNLRDVFETYTGTKSWKWIETLLEIAEGRPVGNVRARVEKYET